MLKKYDLNIRTSVFFKKTYFDTLACAKTCHATVKNDRHSEIHYTDCRFPPSDRKDSPVTARTQKTVKSAKTVDSWQICFVFIQIFLSSHTLNSIWIFEYFKNVKNSFRNAFALKLLNDSQKWHKTVKCVFKSTNT